MKVMNAASGSIVKTMSMRLGIALVNRWAASHTSRHVGAVVGELHMRLLRRLFNGAPGYWSRRRRLCSSGGWGLALTRGGDNTPGRFLNAIL